MAEPEVQSTFHSKNADELPEGLQESNALAQNTFLKGLSLAQKNATFSVQTWETKAGELGPTVSIGEKDEAACF